MRSRWRREEGDGLEGESDVGGGHWQRLRLRASLPAIRKAHRGWASTTMAGQPWRGPSACGREQADPGRRAGQHTGRPTDGGRALGCQDTEGEEFAVRRHTGCMPAERAGQLRVHPVANSSSHHQLPTAVRCRLSQPEASESQLEPGSTPDPPPSCPRSACHRREQLQRNGLPQLTRTSL